MAKIDLPRAMVLAAELARLKATIPSRYDDAAAYEAGVAALTAAISNADPKGFLKQDWQGTTIRACGISTTCTAGVVGACGNYIRRVEALAG